MLPPDTMATTLPGPRAPRLRPRPGPPCTFGHDVRPGRQQADGIRGRVRLDDERPVEQRRQLEHLGKTLGVIPSTKVGVNATSTGPPAESEGASGAAVATSAA